jgi:hypothetical protein
MGCAAHKEDVYWSLVHYTDGTTTTDHLHIGCGCVSNVRVPVVQDLLFRKINVQNHVRDTDDSPGLGLTLKIGE